MPTYTTSAGAFSILNVGTSSTGSMDAGPNPLATNWLAAVQRRVRESIGTMSQVNSGDGKYLSYEAANAAVDFFQIAAAALPGEPFIYKSSAGDLIAEFKTPHGMLTGVVSGNNLSIYPVLEGRLLSENHFNLLTISPGALQSALLPITKALRSGDHGEAVGT